MTTWSPWPGVHCVLEPSGSTWLPWPGRTSRWWFEIESDGQDENGHHVRFTHAYENHGSGGGFTLRRAMIRANEAAWEIYKTKEAQ